MVVEEVLIDYCLSCPKCGESVWVNYKQFLTKNYIVRCDCGATERRPASDVKSTLKILIDQGFNKDKLIRAAKNLDKNLPEDEFIRQVIINYE